VSVSKCGYREIGHVEKEGPAKKCDSYFTKISLSHW